MLVPSIKTKALLNRQLKGIFRIKSFTQQYDTIVQKKVKIGVVAVEVQKPGCH